MKIFFTVLLLSLISSKACFGQYEIAKEYEWSSVLIDINKGENFGSGIFYRDSLNSSLYLVTAKHVIAKYISDDINFKGEKSDVSLILYCKISHQSDSIVKAKMSFNLQKLYQENLIKIHPTKDLSLIEMGIILDSTYHFYKFINIVTKGSIKIITYVKGNLGSFKDAITTRDVFVFGYPKTVGLQKRPQYDFEAPLAQKGIISAKDFNRKSLIVNCPVYGGNSGGPVIQVSDPTKIRLIGIITEFIPYIEKETNIRFNSGYTVVTPIEYILDLIPKR